MSATERSRKYVKFAIYLVVIVLLNLVGLTLFFRVDLTGNKIYSISKVSKAVVSTLKEPLTIKVFFTKNLPAPHNNTERYLHDLLEEYALSANSFFSYEFYNIDPESEGGDAAANANRELAENYSINPVQIQQLEKDELKFKRAYMGLVLIHGDVVEQIPTITSTQGLEYKLTTAMMKANNKISALLNLKDKIQVKLVFSSSLLPVAPFMKVDDLPELPQKIEEIVKNLNVKNYGRLEYSRLDPVTEADQESLSQKYNMPALQWPELGNGKVPAGRGVIGLVMTSKDREVTIPIFQVLRIPIIGTQYQLAEFNAIEEMMNGSVESLVNINMEIGYLADHGTFPLGMSMPMGPQHPESLTSFSKLLNRTYSAEQISLMNETIPEKLKCIVIARPTQQFTDWELYQIDQALMRGQNLAVFLEPFKEIQTQMPDMVELEGQNVRYQPLNTGLEKLLSHYGVSIRKSIVLDEACFVQTLSAEMGGGERPIYFAPIIKNENINKKELPFLANIKGIIMLKTAPVDLDEKRLSENKINATPLFFSSEKSWEMKPPINLNPMFIQKPGPDTPLEKKKLAYLLTGEFPSYFAGKPIPEKETAADLAKKKDAADEKDTKDKKEAVDTELAKITGKSGKLEKGKPSQIFIIGSAELLKNDMIDPEGRASNSMFIMNVLDELNDRGDVAAMRSKIQDLNPLDETSATSKTAIKAFNIVGLPVIVVGFGLVVWAMRHSRRKSIQMMFNSK